MGWDGRTRDSSIPASAFVPHKVTRSKSLFPAARVGFPPKRQLGFEASPPRPLGPCLRAAAPSRPLFSDPSAPSRHPFPTPCASLSSIPGLLASNPGAPVNVPSLPPDVPLRAFCAPSRRGPGTPFLPSLPTAPSRVPTWCGPRPRPVSSASGRLPSPPGPAPLPGGYSLKPLRISLARSSLADMMRRPPPAALPRWPGGASQMVPRSRGPSRPGHLGRAAAATRPGPASPSPQLPLLIPSPSPWPRSARPEANGKPVLAIGILINQ